MIQRRHLESLGLVLSSDILHPKVRKDLILIYNTLDKEIKVSEKKLTHRGAMDIEGFEEVRF